MFSIYAKASVEFGGSREELLAVPKKLKGLIAPALKKKKFKGRRVAAAMPWEDVKIMLLTYKSSVSDVDGEVVRILAGRVFLPAVSRAASTTMSSITCRYAPTRATKNIWWWRRWRRGKR
jgi:hypothetical protein